MLNNCWLFSKIKKNVQASITFNFDVLLENVITFENVAISKDK